MTTKQEGIALLQGVPLFSGLSKRDLGKLWGQVSTAQHDAGHRIIRTGQRGVGFHVILSGTVAVSRPGANIELGPGDHFGEMALIDDLPRSADVTAVTRVETVVLASWDFKSVAMSEPDMLWKMLVATTSRLRSEQTATGVLAG